MPDQFQADEYTQLNRIGLEDHMPGQIRESPVDYYLQYTYNDYYLMYF